MQKGSSMWTILLVLIFHGSLSVISNWSFTCSMSTSMAHWMWYLIYLSLVLCPHPRLTDCDIYFIAHLFHGSLSVIYNLSFTWSMPTSMVQRLWYLLHGSLVLCPHPWFTDCDIYFIVHLLMAHIHGSLIVISISSSTCSMAHWV